MLVVQLCWLAPKSTKSVLQKTHIASAGPPRHAVIVMRMRNLQEQNDCLSTIYACFRDLVSEKSYEERVLGMAQQNGKTVQVASEMLPKVITQAIYT